MYSHRMLRLSVDPHSVTADDLAAAVRALRSGGLVGYPTETFYGLAADPRSQHAVEKIYSVKRRRVHRSLPLIAASLVQVADQVGVMTPLAERLASCWWPGPLTLIIPASPLLCEEVHQSTGKVAVRVPGDSVARALAGSAGHSITSTSANVSGEPPPSTADAVAASFGDRIDVLIDSGPTAGSLPSTIGDATGDAPVLVRAGAIAWDRVLEFLR
jgi:L-threonylcarbamoyladenylate synthase